MLRHEIVPEKQYREMHRYHPFRDKTLLNQFSKSFCLIQELASMHLQNDAKKINVK
jgi:hypothetical protein